MDGKMHDAGVVCRLSIVERETGTTGNHDIERTFQISFTYSSSLRNRPRHMSLWPSARGVPVQDRWISALTSLMAQLASA